MSWRDRPWAGGSDDDFYGEACNLSLPPLTRVVTYLLVINIIVFVLDSIQSATSGVDLLGSLALFSGPGAGLQLWRLITYQFVHANVWHIVFNMLGLYFFGPPLESRFGGRRFLLFYLGCGAAGGLVFLLVGWLTRLYVPIVGASGAVLGLLAGCAVLFPGMTVIVLLFPMPIRLLAVLAGVIYALSVLSERHLSSACHLGGFALGLILTAGPPLLRRWAGSRRRGPGRWQRRQEEERADQETVDRILDKIRREGLASLSWWEKWTLRRATDRQQRRNKRRPQP